jgi:hypothetical protein
VRLVAVERQHRPFASLFMAASGLNERLPATKSPTTAEAAWELSRYAPRRNRTYNLVIKSHLLCQLS